MGSSPKGSALSLTILLVSLHLMGGDVAVHAETPAAEEAWRWEPRVSTGYDVYTQTYSLALEDTTETVGEMEVTLDATGGTRGRRLHNWRIKPRLVFGTERYRQQFAWAYDLKPDHRTSLLRLGGLLQARQYQQSTDYNLNSDSFESSNHLRWLPGYAGRIAGDFKLQYRTLSYADPSELEVDRQDRLFTAALRNGRSAERIWRAGIRLGHRDYPDSGVINRDTYGLELEYDHSAFLEPNIRTYYRGERRRIEDDTVRPSSWGHWGTMETSWPVGDEQLIGELQAEVWHYDTQWGAYNNQWRWTGAAGLRGGGIETPGWTLQLTLEDLDSTDEEESFRQMGVKGGVDHYGDDLTGALTVEIGQRDYSDYTPDLTEDAYFEPLYTDFTYLEVWLILSWRLNQHLSLDSMVNYIPESHSEDTDNQSMGFGNIRILYRF
jgi:hypothetical protein